MLAADVEAPDDLPPLPAAVEVAAYRICQEALMNVVKHADARHVLIRVAAADRLRLEIVDDGVGIPRQRTGESTGVGLGSMRDRPRRSAAASSSRPCPAAAPASASPSPSPPTPLRLTAPFVEFALRLR